MLNFVKSHASRVAPFRSVRSDDWRWVPCRLRQEMMTKPQTWLAIDSAQFAKWLIRHLWGNARLQALLACTEVSETVAACCYGVCIGCIRAVIWAITTKCATMPNRNCLPYESHSKTARITQCCAYCAMLFCAVPTNGRKPADSMHAFDTGVLGVLSQGQVMFIMQESEQMRLVRSERLDD